MARRRSSTSSATPPTSDPSDPITPAVEDEMTRGSIKLIEYAQQRYGSRWVRLIEDIFDEFRFMDTSAGPDPRMQLYYMASLFEFCPRESSRTIAENFLRESRGSLSKLQRQWTQAQIAAWITIWRIVAVVPGKSVILADLLTGEERVVREISGSRTMRPGSALLARVADLPGTSLLAGAHPLTLPLEIAMSLAAEVRDQFQLDDRPTVDALKANEDIALVLLVLWEDTTALARS